MRWLTATIKTVTAKFLTQSLSTRLDAQDVRLVVAGWFASVTNWERQGDAVPVQPARLETKALFAWLGLVMAALHTRIEHHGSSATPGVERGLRVAKLLRQPGCLCAQW